MQKYLSESNTLAYCEMAKLMPKERFILLVAVQERGGVALRVDVIKTFFSPSRQVKQNKLECLSAAILSV